MTREEELRQQAADSGAEVIDWRFDSDRIKGLYCDGVIAVSKRLDTTAEQACVIAEELGHHLTASGDILNQHQVENRKQELKGRAWAYDRLIGLEGIVKAYKAGCKNRFEVSEYLGVPETVLLDAIDYYHKKHGVFARIENYVIFFDPLYVVNTSLLCELQETQS